MQSLLNRLLSIEGESSVDFSRHLAGDDLENALAELDQEVVEGRINLSLDVTALCLGLRDSRVQHGGILGLLGGSEDQGRVGGGILRLVLADG